MPARGFGFWGFWRREEEAEEGQERRQEEAEDGWERKEREAQEGQDGGKGRHRKDRMEGRGGRGGMGKEEEEEEEGQERTLAAGLGPAPGAPGRAADGGGAQQGITLGTGISDQRARAVPGPGAAIVPPVGDAGRRGTLHLCGDRDSGDNGDSTERSLRTR